MQNHLAVPPKPELRSTLAEELLTREQVTVAFVASCIDATIGDGVFDGTVRFMRVRATGKATETHVRAQVAIVACNFFGRHIPEFE